jgi:hypothetical protein
MQHHISDYTLVKTPFDQEQVYFEQANKKSKVRTNIAILMSPPFMYLIYTLN